MSQLIHRSSTEHTIEFTGALHHGGLSKPPKLKRPPTRLRFPGSLTIDDESGALIDLVACRDVAQALDHIDQGAWY